MGLTAFLLTGCRAYQFENATLPEPRDPDAVEIVKTRDGEVEAKIFDSATLQFQRDDSNFVRIVAGLGWESVRLERRFFVKDGTPTVLVLASEVSTSNVRQASGKWVRYERRVGSGTMEATRGTGKPPETYSETTARNRWVRTILLTDLTIPNRPFPFDRTP